MAELGKAPVGYKDTPYLPGSEWRVHDADRPQPLEVKENNNIPSDSIILFEGNNLSEWRSVTSGDAEWRLSEDFMEVVPKSGNIQTVKTFSNIQLHLEFACPSKVVGNSQQRGNSGVFLMGLYEIQIMDGYSNRTYPDGLTGAIYGQYPPLANACRKPGEWQTFDIVFEAPVYNKNVLVEPAYITVFLNGVLLHNRQASQGPTGHKTLSFYPLEHPEKGPLMLQDHGNPVRFRNVWIREL